MELSLCAALPALLISTGDRLPYTVPAAPPTLVPALPTNWFMKHHKQARSKHCTHISQDGQSDFGSQLICKSGSFSMRKPTESEDTFEDCFRSECVVGPTPGPDPGQHMPRGKLPM